MRLHSLAGKGTSLKATADTAGTDLHAVERLHPPLKEIHNHPLPAAGTGQQENGLREVSSRQALTEIPLRQRKRPVSRVCPVSPI